MFPIKEVTGVDLAFPAHVLDMMPDYDTCKSWYRDREHKWSKLASEWFYSGIKIKKVTPKAGVVEGNALAHVACILRSFEPKHEHKMAAVAYLLNEWFDDIDYEVQVEDKKKEKK
jgi:hypothetical protein